MGTDDSLIESRSQKKFALIIVIAASFLTPFVGSAINLAIPSIGQEFHSSAFALSWVVTSYILASAAFLLPFGRLADMVGRKKVFTIGFSFFALFSLFCGLARSIETLIIFRILQGIASSMTFGTAMAILTSVYPPQERGKALGITGATVYVGLSLGPVLGGAMNHYLGWESIFFLNVPVGLFIVLFTLWKLKGEWAYASGEKFDWTGAVLYTIGLIGFMFGLSAIAKYPEAKFIFLVGLAVLALFVRHEIKEKSPILNVRLFSSIGFAFSNLSALINYSATFAVTFLLSLHLQVVMGIPSQLAGLVLLAQPVIMAALSPFAGALSDRVEPRIVSSWGMSITTLGLLILTFISESTPIWFIAVNLALLGFGFALFSSPNSNAVMSSVEKTFYGVASSTLASMRLIGQTISMAIVTMIIALFVGNVTLTPAYADLLVKSTRLTFIIFTLICVGGIFASLARGNVNRTAEK